MKAIKVLGECRSKFTPVRDAFRSCLALYAKDTVPPASLAVYHQGEKVLGCVLR